MRPSALLAAFVITYVLSFEIHVLAGKLLSWP